MTQSWITISGTMKIIDSINIGMSLYQATMATMAGWNMIRGMENGTSKWIKMIGSLCRTDVTLQSCTIL